MNRNRLAYTAALGAVIAIGLASRRWGDRLPEFVAAYVGDALWALAVFLALGIFLPRWSSRRVASAALLIAFGVEFSQLYHAPWIDRLRSLRLGGLILGFGFLWSDLACYAVGIAAGYAAERTAATIRRRSGRHVIGQ